mmetsp:Transcript_67730/g.189005  ORF Transcript_67730/g.189005 Transcript_67730/m.189005 type:complete len:427 (+) Transcript_67730:1-1281(+)
MRLIADRLYWAPEGNGVPAPGDGKYQVVSVRDLHEEVYEVIHYPASALGRAFGPLSVRQMLQFCHKLHCMLEGGSDIVVTTPTRDLKIRTNSAVLIGAYLALVHDFNLEAIVEAVGVADAERKFCCSWARTDKPEPRRLMAVGHCWEGVILARDEGWLSKDCVTKEATMLRTCEEHLQLSRAYDASWLVPGRIMVCADPVTTSLDPNPCTFSDIFPQVPQADRFYMDRESSAASVTSSPGSKESHSYAATEPNSPCTNLDSCNSVNKEYQHDFDDTNAGLPPLDFVSFLKSNGVGLVVRTNFMSEPGLKRSYDENEFAKCDIQHINVEVPDQNGGVPLKGQFEATWKKGESILTGSQAVAIHCKCGFGRSVMVACYLAAKAYNLPGRALLGWVRLARPGAVNTPQQEAYLLALGTGPSEQVCCALM